jgi:hypothetical protein
MKVGRHTIPQVFGLADVDDLSFGVFVEVHAGGHRQGADFLVKVHGKGAKCSLKQFWHVILLWEEWSEICALARRTGARNEGEPAQSRFAE